MPSVAPPSASDTVQAEAHTGPVAVLPSTVERGLVNADLAFRSLQTISINLCLSITINGNGSALLDCDRIADHAPLSLFTSIEITLLQIRCSVLPGTGGFLVVGINKEVPPADQQAALTAPVAAIQAVAPQFANTIEVSHDFSSQSLFAREVKAMQVGPPRWVAFAQCFHGPLTPVAVVRFDAFVTASCAGVAFLPI